MDLNGIALIMYECYNLIDESRESRLEDECFDLFLFEYLEEIIHMNFIKCPILGDPVYQSGMRLWIS